MSEIFFRTGFSSGGDKLGTACAEAIAQRRQQPRSLIGSIETLIALLQSYILPFTNQRVLRCNTPNHSHVEAPTVYYTVEPT
ncbi:hypothetical protein F7734_13025 [Scytonema sp. UIC 10036]|uniref:hypothetical protein n=1 Tax=Scytonema sp. UIC 10036 TaxID=2304196 RepID=UPI0012DAF45F|nr:hypothetical protein [Scytonema sp. UIC 10036]MUG93299.1 hypothetical protein [Scytonema sp. UIC 10036]MUG93300.1 hypothetical protein [Scytonema sp. UIC 10036]